MRHAICYRERFTGFVGAGGLAVYFDFELAFDDISHFNTGVCVLGAFYARINFHPGLNNDAAGYVDLNRLQRKTGDA